MLAVTLLGTAIRIYKLGQWSFWADELATIGHASAHFSSFDAIIRNTPPQRNWIPISLILAGSALNALGVSELAARLAAASIGIVSIPILFFPIRKLFNPGVGLIASLLLAFSPWHVYWSQNARFYTSLMLFYTLALFAFFFALERDRLVYIFLFIGFFYLAISERLIALFIAPVLGAYLLLLWVLPKQRPAGYRARNILLMASPGIAAIVIEAYSLIAAGSSRFFADFGWFPLRSIDDPFRLLANISFNIGIPLATLSFFAGIHLLRERSRHGYFLVICAFLPTLLLGALNPFFFTVDRYVFATLPAWLILAAFGVSELLERVKNRGTWLVIGILIILLADASGDHLMYFQFNHGNRPQWREAFAYVEERMMPDDVVVSSVARIGTYYLKQDVVALKDIQPDAIVGDDATHWFVVDSENVWWADDNWRWLEANGDLLDVRYLRVRENIHLRIYRYEQAF